MAISLLQEVKGEEALDPSILSRILGQPVLEMTRLPGGRNSQVFVLDASDGRKFVAKHYFARDINRASGLRVEFHSLRFLWDQGERAIPEPVAIDENHRLAVYTMLEGRPADSFRIGEAGIDQTVDFLLRLKDLSKRRGALNLPHAREARFSIAHVVENIENRLERLKSVGQSTPNHQALAHFLSEIFEPSMRRISCGGREKANNLGIAFDKEIDQKYRTLSPSDFGIHNAVIQDGGRFAFLDFEYFGWDDPAKMISDFLLHPGMDLGPENQARFFSGITSGFSDNQALVDRIKIVAPFFALKWCLILLNEFIPEGAARRAFASTNSEDQTKSQGIQLQKAIKMAGIAEGFYDQFSF